MAVPRVRRLARLVLPLALALAPLPALAAPGGLSPGTVPPDRASSDQQDGVALVRIVVPDRAGIDRLQQLGVDLAEYTKPTQGGIEVHAVLSPDQTAQLRAAGFDVRGKVSDQADAAAVREERAHQIGVLA